MKIVKWIATVTLLFTFACSASAGDKEDVLAFLEGGIKAFNTKDKAAYASNLADDFQSFSGVQTPLLYETKASWMNWIDGLWELPFVSYTQQQNSVRVYNGNSAVVNGYFIFKVVRKDGSLTTVSGRATIDVVKWEGKWKIVNYHFSNLF
jgi:ketosteroid isomerase-like protein